jgi:phosphohistidine phosphatase SixA
MRYVIICYAFLSYLASCTKNDVDTQAPLQWAANTTADSAVVDTSAIINLAVNNNNAVYSISKGFVNTNFTTTTGTQQGKIIVVVKNPLNPTDSLKKTFFVSQYKKLFTQMANGGYVLSYRHADASLGTDIFTAPSGWHTSCDAALARQLSNATAVPQATELGLCMRLHKLPIKRIFSSEFCRCKTTAQLFAIPNVPIITNTDITYYVYNEAQRYTLQTALMAAQPQDNFNTILIGHAGFSTTPNPAPLANLGWGDFALFKLNGTAAPEYILSVDDVALRAMLY